MASSPTHDTIVQPTGVSTGVSLNQQPFTEHDGSSHESTATLTAKHADEIQSSRPGSASVRQPPAAPSLPSSTSFSSPPINKTLEILAVAWHVYSIPVILAVFLLCCAFPPFWPFVFIYLVYFFIDKGSENGSAPDRSSMLLRASPLWKYFANYFPIVIHKTCELEPAFKTDETERDFKRQLDQDDVSFTREEEEEVGERDPVAPSSASKETSAFLAFSDHTDDSTAYTTTDEEDVGANEEEHGGLSGDEGSLAGDNEGDDHHYKSHSANIISSSSRYDRDDQEKNSHRWFGVRLFVWDIVRWLWAVFTLKREPTQQTRTGKQYIFGYHPHGIIGMGAVGGIATEGAHWSKLFPGVPVTTLTLVNQFQIPLYREYLLSLGLACVSKRSCLNLLKRGQSICILLGGAQESLLARPGYMDLVLRKRQGFVKLAMTVPGTSLVPMISFGENNVYDQVQNDPNSRLYNIQTFLKNSLGFTLPLMHARGIFNYDFGIIPYRRPINIVVGEPIEVPHIEEPTPEQVAEHHLVYMEAVKKLFDEHKDKFHSMELFGDEVDYQELRFIE